MVKQTADTTLDLRNVVLNQNNSGKESFETIFLSDDETLYSHLYANTAPKYGSRGTTTPDLMFLIGLMESTVCYVEYKKDSYIQKYLVCRNPAIISLLTGKPLPTYVIRELEITPQDLYENYVKTQVLSLTKAGFKLGKDVYTLPADKITCIPLFLLDTLSQSLFNLLETGAYTISYCKDNGTIRNLDTTLNSSIWGTLYDTNVSMEYNTTLTRGYITTPWLGGSIHEKNLTRSINLARITEIKKLQKVDLSILDLDINLVESMFIPCLLELYNNLGHKDSKSEESIKALTQLIELINIPNFTTYTMNWKSLLLNYITTILTSSSQGVYFLFNCYRQIDYIKKTWSIFDKSFDYIDV